VVVACAGNSDTDLERRTQMGPASLRSVVSVGALSRGRAPSSFTHYGDAWVSVYAPGEGLLGPRRGGGYSEFDGTSVAAPLVAGVAALMVGVNGNLTSGQVRTILMLEATVPGTQDPDGNFLRLVEPRRR